MSSIVFIITNVLLVNKRFLTKSFVANLLGAKLISNSKLNYIELELISRTTYIRLVVLDSF